MGRIDYSTKAFRAANTCKEVFKKVWLSEESICTLCGNVCNQKPICSDCLENYFYLTHNRCLSCGKIILPAKTRCEDCRAGRGPEGLAIVTSLGYYNEEWKKFIHKVKFMSQPYLLMNIAGLITDWAAEKLPPADGLVPVPLHPARLMNRGFNQSEILASIISRYLGMKYCDILRREKDTIPQTELNRQQRLENLKGAFVLKDGNRTAGNSYWLIDDVTTTGATLAECARVLKNSGAKNIYAFCLASGKEK